MIISFTVFLFVLFFQPFPLKYVVFEDRLLYVTGFGIILFLVALGFLVILPLALPKWFTLSIWEDTPPVMLSLLFFLFTGTAFAFYIRFVGKTPLDLYVLFKIALVCLIPIGILWVWYRIKVQEQVIRILRKEIVTIKDRPGEQSSNGDDAQITFTGGTRSDVLQVAVGDILSLRSSDNYVEICYVAGTGQMEKKLVRNTLKGVESQLKDHSRFVRCHRSSIINAFQVEKFFRKYGVYHLKMNNMDEIIPVSRPYVNRLRQALSVPG